MSNTTVKTIWHLELEAATRPGNTYVPSAYSTLNGFFNIQEAATLGQNEFPEAKILVIGRGGHENTGVDITDTKQHRINNACLFEHLPFILRETSDDLDDATRAKYRFRRLENHGGKDYFAYYGKVLTAVTTVTETKTIDTSTVPPTITPYVPSDIQYTPQAVSMTNGVINSATNTMISVADKQEIVITNAEIASILDAVDIIYGDRRKAVISEMAIASSFDRNFTSNEGGISVNYTEAVGSQILSFLGGSRRELQSQNVEIRKILTVGNSLGLLT